MGWCRSSRDASDPASTSWDAAATTHEAGTLGRLEKRPYDYFRMFYADTATFGSVPATECGLAFFGADHVLFASDAPFDPEKGSGYIRSTLAVMEGITASIEDKQKIFEGNARRLLKLDA